ncbi:DNA repair protein RecN [Hahella sp. HN01]|uniref:DNA repair protein RecN n=1 Tax=Hahella sp. HN01 TaxID=2847262 RepID=UPI001C1EA54B|nr:DNA repair protein RecN [Hahella sp. HN01]MBU6951985.1 DNA repair protein RecN [Hahella sp. HN01]
MLTHLSIRNLAIASHLELDFAEGMTAISGETGAGKSIVLDALGLTLGDRSSADIVRHGCERAEVSAVFDLRRLPEALAWLKSRELDNGAECILRRTVTNEGRSRGYLNGQPVTMQDLRELGETLMDIHSQHEHQSLLKKETHLKMVDDFGGHSQQLQQVRDHFQSWRRIAAKLKEKLSHSEEQEARLQLLTYQVEELDALALLEGEIEQLEQEQEQLANAENIIMKVQQVGEGCLEADGGCIDQLRRAIHLLEEINLNNASLQTARQMLNEAMIQLDEANGELRHVLDSVEINPERLQEVEARLTAIYDLARKHRVAPEELMTRHVELASELNSLTDGEENLEKLEAQSKELEQKYNQAAKKLTSMRTKAGEKLQGAVKKQLVKLGLNPEFIIQFSPLKSPSALGDEEAEMLISMNPGQPPKPLQKIASGGELSRISLAIQVVAAASSDTPTLVFDEVDVGIGGGTAEIVGRMLRELGAKAQILCVTHLAQVASQAHNHLFVTKHVSSGQTQSAILKLEGSDRIHEIARMLGGVDITEHSLAHAHEMLTSSQLQ